MKLFALSVNSILQLKKKTNNDHLVLSSNLKSNKITVFLSVLIDIKVIDYAFIDDFFAQQNNLFLFSLSESRTFHEFENNLIVFELITHYVMIKLRVLDKKIEETFFYVIKLSQFSVISSLF